MNRLKIPSRKSRKDRQYNGQKETYERRNNDIQKIHRKLKLEQHEPHLESRENKFAPEGLAVAAPPIVFFFKQINLSQYHVISLQKHVNFR
jgi:hypothetical protein